jgi:large subunit ribosomal protein L25
MADSLHVELRETRGKLNARRMRKAGQTPAILYGHNLPNVALAVPSDQLKAAVRHGAHLVNLEGAVSESALLREVQWDAFGSNVLHVDLARVDADELVKVTISVELRGDAPGTHHGGVVEQHLHEVDIECAATAIPDRLQLNINALDVGQSLTASVLELPTGARLLTDPDAVLASCSEPVEREEVLAAPPAAEAEPEVIGRKPAEAEEAESS